MKLYQWLLIVVIFLSGVALGVAIGHQNPSTRISTESQMSAYEAELFIKDVIRPHQYYIDHPEDQNYATGDTEHNQRIISQYLRLQNLIKAIK